MTRIERKIAAKGAPLIGVSVARNDPVFVELASMTGFDVLWIESEHQPLGAAEATDLCRLADALGMLTMVRVNSPTREQVLKVAEGGPDVIDLPMGNSPEVLAQLVEHALYPPVGSRGFFSSSRAVRYGISGDITAERARINEELLLMAQVETMEAVERLDELCAVPGIGGIFIGPGDLSTSMGMAGQLQRPELLETIERIIAGAKSHGRVVAIAWYGAGAARWAACGADIIFCGGDVACLRESLRGIQQRVRGELAS